MRTRSWGTSGATRSIPASTWSRRVAQKVSPRWRVRHAPKVNLSGRVGVPTPRPTESRVSALESYGGDLTRSGMSLAPPPVLLRLLYN